jgi:hypothetical protein
MSRGRVADAAAASADVYIGRFHHQLDYTTSAGRVGEDAGRVDALEFVDTRASRPAPVQGRGSRLTPTAASSYAALATTDPRGPRRAPCGSPPYISADGQWPRGFLPSPSKGAQDRATTPQPDPTRAGRNNSTPGAPTGVTVPEGLHPWTGLPHPLLAAGHDRPRRNPARRRRCRQLPALRRRAHRPRRRRLRLRPTHRPVGRRVRRSHTRAGIRVRQRAAHQHRRHRLRRSRPRHTRSWPRHRRRHRTAGVVTAQPR